MHLTLIQLVNDACQLLLKLLNCHACIMLSHLAINCAHGIAFRLCVGELRLTSLPVIRVYSAGLVSVLVAPLCEHTVIASSRTSEARGGGTGGWVPQCIKDGIKP